MGVEKPPIIIETDKRKERKEVFLYGLCEPSLSL